MLLFFLFFVRHKIDINPFTTFPILQTPGCVMLCSGFTSYPIVEVALFGICILGRNGGPDGRQGGVVKEDGDLVGIGVQLFLVRLMAVGRLTSRGIPAYNLESGGLGFILCGYSSSTIVSMMVNYNPCLQALGPLPVVFVASLPKVYNYL